MTKPNIVIDCGNTADAADALRDAFLAVKAPIFIDGHGRLVAHAGWRDCAVELASSPLLGEPLWRDLHPRRQTNQPPR